LAAALGLLLVVLQLGKDRRPLLYAAYALSVAVPTLGVSAAFLHVGQSEPSRSLSSALFLLAIGGACALAGLYLTLDHLQVGLGNVMLFAAAIATVLFLSDLRKA
jgi:hypothetical protein